MDGKVTPVADQATDPIYTFSKSNVVDGEFSYTGTSTKVRPNQLVRKAITKRSTNNSS